MSLLSMIAGSAITAIVTTKQGKQIANDLVNTAYKALKNKLTKLSGEPTSVEQIGEKQTIKLEEQNNGYENSIKSI